MASSAFTVADARALAVGRSRLRRRDLVHIHHGVVAHRRPVSFEERAAWYLPRLGDGQVFSHATAAGLLGMPVPRSLLDGPLHVSAVYPAHAPRVPGVVAHRLRERPGLLDEHAGFPVTSEEETWCLLGLALALPDLVAAGDHLLRNGVEDPTAALHRLAAAMHVVHRRRLASLERAYTLLRPGVRSAMESVMRVLIVLGGLPEPEVNVRIFARDGRFLGEGDLVYRRWKALIEYEGDGHRTDTAQFRKDITRREGFEDEGWSVIRVTVDDLFPTADVLIARIARRIGLR